MKTLKMPDLTFKTQGKTLKIPGGWDASVPVIKTVDDAAVRAYSRFFQTKYGYSQAEGEEEFLQRLQDLLDASWRRHLQESLKHYARRYAKYHPEKIQDDGTLLGFDPARVQRAWMMQEITGRAGKEGVERLFDDFVGIEET